MGPPAGMSQWTRQLALWESTRVGRCHHCTLQEAHQTADDAGDAVQVVHAACVAKADGAFQQRCQVRKAQGRYGTGC